MKTLILFLAALLVNTAAAFGQDSFDYNKYFSAKGDSLLYRSLKPAKIEQGKKYPLLIFLHGAGQKGNDNEKQLLQWSNMFLNPYNRDKYPAFVVFPQCPRNDYWAYDRVPKNFDNLPYPDKMNPTLTLVKELIDQYLLMPEVDKSRVYVVGFSMGGVGTYELVSRYPEIFAAAVPLCGAIAPGHLGGAKDVKFRIFHGDEDPTVPVECSRRVYKELKAIGAEFEYIEYPAAKHGICGQTFSRPDFMEWIFAQKRGKRIVPRQKK